MSSSLTLGPFALPLAALAFAAAAAAGAALGQRLARRAGVDAGPALWRVLLVGLVAARLFFVWQWHAAYATEPWSLLDLRDGGWNPGAGLAAACFYALSRARREAALKRPLVAAIGLAGALWLAASAALALRADDGPPLPARTFATVDGGALSLTALAGAPVVVNLWATWCPPCRREMPLLQQAQAAHPEIHFVFADQGESRAEVAAYLLQHQLALQQVVLDPGHSLGALFDEDALPTTLFFDAGGRLVATRVGALSAATLQQQLAAFRR